MVEYKLSYLNPISRKTQFENKIIYVKKREEIENEPDKIHTIKLNPYLIWTNSSNRQEKMFIDFNPTVENGIKLDKSVFNTWRGYKYKKDDNIKVNINDISPFLNHIREVWCNNNEIQYNYVLDWFATLIQTPWVKLKTVIVLRSKPGAGKGIIIQKIREIIDGYFEQPSSPDEVLGNFNSILRNVKLLFLDEMCWGGDKKASGILKKLITEETLTLKQKFITNMKIHNYMALIMASNEKWVVPAGMHSRRFFMLETSEKYVSAKSDLLRNELKKIAKVPTDILAQFFYKRDLSKFNHFNIPKSKALALQTHYSLSPVEKYWSDVLSNDDLNDVLVGDCLISFKVYQQFSQRITNKHITSSIFWKQSRSIFKFNKTRRRLMGKITYIYRVVVVDLKDKFSKHVGDEDWFKDNECVDDGHMDDEIGSEMDDFDI